MQNLKPGVYLEKPTSFSRNITSCSCFIKCKNKILFLKKAPTYWCENLWGIPCGTLQDNEDIFSCVKRELKEEIGYEVDSFKYLGKVFIVQNDMVHNIHNVFFHETNQRFPVKISQEHSDFKWLTKEDLSVFDLIPNQKQVLSVFDLLNNK